MNTWSPTRADFDRLNERIGQLVAEGFPFSEAMDQARGDVPGWPHEDWLGDRVKLTLLRAPNDDSHRHPSFQAEIKEFDTALKGWRPRIRGHVAYLKRRTGRKVQVECDGLKLKIEEPTTDEADRVLTLIERRYKAKQKKK